MTIEQTCPLCGKTATYKISHGPYCKHFTCQQCAEFFIDAHSESYIANLPEITKSERRKKLSETAKACPANQVFVIREPRSDERRGDGHGVARTEMIAQCLSR